MPVRLLIFLMGCLFLGTEPVESRAQCRNPVSQWAYALVGPSGGGYVDNVAVAPNGNVLFTGTFGGIFDFDPGEGSDIHVAPNGAVFVTTLHADGSYGWTRSLLLDGYNLGIYSIAFDVNGNVLLAGAFVGTVDLDPTDGVDERTTVGHTNAFLIRLTPNGDYLGTTVFGTGTTGTDEAGAGSVAVDRAGNILLAGGLRGTVDFDPTDGVDSHTGNSFVTRFYADGSYAWTRTWGNELFGGAYAVGVDADGSVFVRGEFRGTVDFDPGEGEDLHTALAPGAVYVTRFNADGSYGWTRTWDIYSSRTYDGLTVDRDGNVLITGGFSGTRDFDPSPDVEDWHWSEGSGSAYIIKLAGNGAYLWTRQIGGSKGSASGNGIAANPNGGVAVAGFFSGTVDFDPGEGMYERTSMPTFDDDVFVTMLDADGSHVWTRTFGGAQDDEGRVLGVDDDGSVVVGGYFRTSADLDPGCAEDIHRSDLIGATFGYLVKLGCVPPTADGNGDGVVNLLDLAALQNCFSGSAPTTCNPGCYQFDFDGDDDIDLLDFAGLQRVFTAP